MSDRTDPARIQSLIDFVIATEVCFPVKSEPEVDSVWMEEMIGERRWHHPMFEARTGWLDYLEGTWAFERRNDYVCYWFESRVLMAKFMLMYGGKVSKDLVARDWRE
jgi:hypothetical protein